MLSWKKALLTEKRVFGVAEAISSNLSRKYFKIFEKFPLKCPQQTGFFVRLRTVELQIWPILWHWSFSIHPENIRKPEVFLWFLWIWKETCGMKSVKKKKKKRNPNRVFSWEFLEIFNQCAEYLIHFWPTLRKIPWFHLISWCGNFVERYSFHTRKLSEITVFRAVQCSPFHTPWNARKLKVF